MTKILPFCLLLILGFVWSESPAKSQTPSPASVSITKGQRIYACHHSYFLPVPSILEELAKWGGFPDQVLVGTHYIGGSKSIRHWNIPDDQNAAKAALIAGKIDVLILPPVCLPDDGIEKFARLALDHNPNIRVTVMELWLPFDVYNPTIYDKAYVPVSGEPKLQPKPAQVDHNAATGPALEKMHEYYFQTMNDKIAALNQKFKKQVIFVVPMGQAVIALREKVIANEVPGIKTQEELFKDQLGHPNPPLAVLEAYCHYAVIYRKSPVGLPIPSMLTTAQIPKDQIEPLNQLLQQIAWNAVIHHPLSGVQN